METSRFAVFTDEAFLCNRIDMWVQRNNVIETLFFPHLCFADCDVKGYVIRSFFKMKIQHYDRIEERTEYFSTEYF